MDRKSSELGRFQRLRSDLGPRITVFRGVGAPKLFSLSPWWEPWTAY